MQQTEKISHISLPPLPAITGAREGCACAQRVDVCIICALEEEVSAVEHEVSTRCQALFTTAVSANGQLAYRQTTITNARHEPLTLLLFCLTRPGLIATLLDLSALLQTIQPRFIAMSGICAGDRRHLRLGDLVVAEYAYHYQAGKIEQNAQGELIPRPEWVTHGPTNQILRLVRHFQDWKTSVATLPRPDQQHTLPDCLIAAMASGITVQSAEPFSLLQQHNYKTWALDMETAAFYQVLQDFPHIASLAVKGVSDYADPCKDDRYHAYAARASAVYLLCFIQAYISP